MARPKTGKYDNIVENIIEYTKNTEYPILKEVCFLYNYNYDTVMKMQRDNEELMQSIKQLLNKKEAYLEREGIKGTINPTMAVFTLKQLGWRDKPKEEEEKNVKNGIIVDLLGALKDAKKD